MDAPLAINIRSPIELWVLVQNGFTLKVARWDDFYTTGKFLVRIYDLIKIQTESKTMVNLKKYSPINQGDTAYRDLITGNYLIIQQTADTTRVFVVPHG